MSEYLLRKEIPPRNSRPYSLKNSVRALQSATERKYQDCLRVTEKIQAEGLCGLILEYRRFVKAPGVFPHDPIFFGYSPLLLLTENSSKRGWMNFQMGSKHVAKSMFSINRSLIESLDYVRSPDSLCSIHRIELDVPTIFPTENEREERFSILNAKAMEGWDRSKDFTDICDRLETLYSKNSFDSSRFFEDCYGLSYSEFCGLVDWMEIFQKLL